MITLRTFKASTAHVGAKAGTINTPGGISYYQRHKAKILARARARREADPDLFRERSRKWRAENPESSRASVRRWAVRHPGYFAVVMRARRAAGQMKFKSL